MQDLINNPDLLKYTVTFETGDVIFVQGDNTKDMYILISGKLEIYKDEKKIAEYSSPGTTVGEMSFMLGTKRTVTLKALTEVKMVRIPSDKIEDSLHEYPTLAQQMSLKLAKRLEETTRIMHGLREFCDQLPDAIIMADKDRNILSWNQAAEKLYGKTWQQMKGFPLADLYQSPQTYRQFIQDVQAGNSLSEKELAVKHPDEEEHYVSTSTTVLYDGHHNVEGYIFLSRDVTKIKDLEKKYKRIRNWLIPACILFFLMIVSLFFIVPHFSKGARILDYKKETFKKHITDNSLSISGSLSGPLESGDMETVASIMGGYFTSQNPGLFGIKGLILLDHDKRVISVYSSKTRDDASSIIGTNYSGIKFMGDEKAAYKVLSLFRTDKLNPMGVKGAEIAYGIRKSDGEPINWLVFQLEMDTLNREYGIDTKVLSNIRFRNK